jgi:hypothetical protein
LRDRYDTAFQSWAEEMNQLQRIRSEAADASDVNSAEVRTTAAETTYRETRDQLAEEMATAAGA